VAERIRAVSGRDASASRGKEDALLKSLQADNKRLHQDKARLNADIARLASIVQTLTDEIARLRALSTGQVVEMGKQSNR
jgi:cell division protein FtsB